MDLVQRLQSLGGVARRSELTCRPTELRELVDRGVIRLLGAGWVALDGASAALVAARRLNATITCVSAATFYSLAVLAPSDDVHVAIPRERGARRGPVRVHRESLWTRPDGPIPLAPPAEVVSRLLRCQPAESAIVMADSALNKRLVTVDQLYGTLVGPGSAPARAALKRCDGRSRSAIETLARLALKSAGLRVEAGVVIAGVGEVDLLVEGWVVVECDGFAYHSGRHEYREDRRRDRVLVALGYLVLRFTWEDIMGDPQAVVDAVRQALRSRVPQRAPSAR